MPRKKSQLPYKIAKRKLPKGGESQEYYAQIRNEEGKRVWIKLGMNYKEAEKKLRATLSKIEKERKPEQKSESKTSKTFLEYLIEHNYFEPEKNVQRIYYLDTGKESYGLSHSKQVANYFHRLFDEDKDNDPIGSIPYRNIRHKDALDLWLRLRDSKNFTTGSTRNRLLDMLSSTYSFIQKDDEELMDLKNPFRSIEHFKETKQERLGMTVEQIKVLFADEETINSKVIAFLTNEDAEKTRIKINKITESARTENQKKRLIKNMLTWQEKKRQSYLSYRFTDTQYYRYFKFILGTGIRGAECRALQYSAFKRFPFVNIEQSFKEQNSERSSIGDPKWGKKRNICLCDTLKEMMEYAKPISFNQYANEYEFSKNPEAFVFSQDPNGNTPLCSNELREQWRVFTCAMGFKKGLFTPHSLRHSLASTLMLNGFSSWLVARWGGWENPTTGEMLNNYSNVAWNEELVEYKDIAAVLEEKYFK